MRCSGTTLCRWPCTTSALKGFGDEGRLLRQLARPGAATGGHDDGDGRPVLVGVARKAEPVERPRHLDVGEEDGETVAVLLEQPKRLVRMHGGQDFEAGLLEDGRGVGEDDRVVVDHEGQGTIF